MMKLKNPEYSFEESLNKCVSGIKGNRGLERQLKISSKKILDLESEYIESAASGRLSDIPPLLAEKGIDPLVVNTLRRKDFIKIYDQYFVPEQKPARKIYDALLNAAKEECPFCGGIGVPRNLDHFLPKTYFPQFSFMPINLVPACRDCNMDGMSSGFAKSSEEQIIQPYLDKDIFFTDQWIFATYNWVSEDEPGEFLYSVNAPGEWSEIDKERVQSHFEDFGLAKRYSTKAAQMLGTVLLQIRRLKKHDANVGIIKEVLLEPGEEAAPFPNHWQRAFYQALKQALV